MATKAEEMGTGPSYLGWCLGAWLGTVNDK